ncbi:hypothetical protein A6395_13410 [Exiguobacterium sp. SH31]|uniref:hypothetical protein n=1 Tax=Exiguobacterium sp. SH31 TaxID=1843183 RepID=UPI0008B9DA9D|nr:hypothetical protein [Exiguobacterium sp. SH31]OGX78214.1 hypothetical protein A6395_13410 [Exiguobacterium sp. SH31]
MSNTQTDKARQIFLQARRFTNAGGILGDKISETNDLDLYLAPFIVNTSFAIELYLKCIYVIEQDKEPKFIHHLDELYNKLSKESKGYISTVFEMINQTEHSYHALKDKVPDFDWSIEGVLRSSSKAFVNWRYSFQSEVTGFPSSRAVISALEACIFILREDLNDTPQPQM